MVWYVCVKQTCEWIVSNSATTSTLFSISMVQGHHIYKDTYMGQLLILACQEYLCALAKLKDDDIVAAFLQYTHTNLFNVMFTRLFCLVKKAKISTLCKQLCIHAYVHTYIHTYIHT